MLHTLITTADALIAATTPDFRPRTPFDAAPYNGPLETLPFGSSPNDGTRRYHVLSGVGHDGGGPRVLQVQGTLLHMSDQLVVRIRYHVPLRDGGLLLAHRMMGSDAARISHALVSGITGCSLFAPAGTARVDSAAALGATDTPDVFIMTIPFDIQYHIGATTP